MIDKTYRIRLAIAFLIIFSIAIAVVFHSATLMLRHSDKLENLLAKQFRDDQIKQPRRGQILDRNHEPLAVNLDVQSLYATPEKYSAATWRVAEELSKVLNMPIKTIQKKLKQKKYFVWLKRHLTPEEELAVKRILENDRRLHLLLGLTEESRRFYPNQSLAAHILGFTNIDLHGLEGVELTYDKALAGAATSGDEQVEGNTVVLTIDKALQHITEEEIAAVVEKTHAESAQAIIMDANTGEIIALANYPTFNPNQFSKYSADERRNRVVTDAIEPGSTIKPILVAGGIDNSLITPTTKFFCENGRFKVGNHWINEAEEKKKWQWLSVTEIVQHSSNIGAAKIGFKIGPRIIFDWYTKQGIAKNTEIDLPGEAKGKLVSPKAWSKIMQSNLAFGQGLMATPIQLVRAYASFANGGYLVHPKIVKEVLDFEGKVVSRISTNVTERIMKPETAEKVANLLTKVTTEDGTAPKAAIDGFLIAGKTGTAQKAVLGRGYVSGKYIASFIGFAKNTKPNYVALVMVNEPKSPVYFGGEVAAPVFHDIMSAALAKAGVLPMHEMINRLVEKSPKNQHEEANIMFSDSVAESSAAENKMPNLMGASAKEVFEKFDNLKVNLEIKGSGIVVNQSPLPGKDFHSKEKITVWLERPKLMQ